MVDWMEVGPHRYYVDGDMLYWCPSGAVLPEHVDAVCALLGGINAAYGYALWLVDAFRSIPVGYESRRRYADFLLQWPGTLFGAAFRATFAARTTADLTIRAVQLRGRVMFTIENFDTEHAARSYLRQQAAAQLQVRATVRQIGDLR